MRSMGLQGWTQKWSARNGGERAFVVPAQGEFERAPKGPGATEVTEVTYNAMLARDDDRLKTCVERKFAGWAGPSYSPLQTARLFSR